MALFGGDFGLWRDGRCVIITRAADVNLQGSHDRMPVIIPLDRRNQWLKPGENVASKPPIVRLDATPKLTMRPVSRRLNSIVHDDPECLLAGEVQTDLSLFPDGD